ncbi:MAG: methyltransferase domain-containing protein [Anaerolineae bacterium]|nr:methyltransferase domain-containing protein [Anaerolineae bacterium]
MMRDRLTEREYLRAEQYADSSNLDARAALHRRFSVNRRGWSPWVFDQFDLPPAARVLEVGCGPAYLWAENRARVPAGWDITLSDFSPGMVRKARAALDVTRFKYVNLDVQAMPFPAARFDAIIANHMLYHVPDLAKAMTEIRRVLKPGSALYAATNGRAHMSELFELASRFDARPWPQANHPFLRETGRDDLAPHFDTVEWRPYEDALVVTEVEPLLAYVFASARASFTEERRAAFAAHVEELIARAGAFHITKDSGLFVARAGA